ncbi:MAG: Rne/Rng family ribonuclease [Candidatus Kapabacteria bacterium]|nr:Rne/Rng family ribonuclease [Candidatus Kapabacteria bacterium]
MKKEIIINSTLNEVRIAITEDSRLSEFHIELPDKERYIGNLYLGKVSRIVPGLNAAFINIGLKQDAFLHFSDIDESMEHDKEDADQDDDDFDDDVDDLPFDVEPLPQVVTEASKSDIALRKAKSGTANDSKVMFNTKRSGNVHINLEPKQDVIVQVVREAFANKGVKVTTKITVPGRYVVLLPFENTIGVSKKIESRSERRRLRAIAKEVLPAGVGCIIRTTAQGKGDELVKDWESVLDTWHEIEKKVQKSKSPALLYQDMQLAASVIRDTFNKEVDKVWIDSKKLYKEVITYLKKKSSGNLEKVELYTNVTPIFDYFGIEKDLETTYKRRVPLSGGGSAIFDQTEAMLVIDVNSGRAYDKEQETAAYKTNVDALREIARQIRLRDIGGIVLIDFIDMTQEANRKKLFNEMRRELDKDRAKTVVYPLTRLCLMQITRQRVNQNIMEKTSEICTMCEGSGRVRSKTALLSLIERWLKNFRLHSREFRLILHIHPSMANFLNEGTISRLSRFMLKYFVKISIRQADDIPMGGFKFFSAKQQKDITKDYL